MFSPPDIPTQTTDSATPKLPAHAEILAEHEAGASVEHLAAKYGVTPRSIRVRVTKAHRQKQTPYDAARHAAGIGNSQAGTPSNAGAGANAGSVPGAIGNASNPATLSPAAIASGADALVNGGVRLWAGIKGFGAHPAVDKYAKWGSGEREVVEGLAPLVADDLNKWLGENKHAGVILFCVGIGAIAARQITAILAEVKASEDARRPNDPKSAAAKRPNVQPHPAPAKAISPVDAGMASVQDRSAAIPQNGSPFGAEMDRAEFEQMGARETIASVVPEDMGFAP